MLLLTIKTPGSSQPTESPVQVLSSKPYLPGHFYLFFFFAVTRLRANGTKDSQTLHSHTVTHIFADQKIIFFTNYLMTKIIQQLNSKKLLTFSRFFLDFVYG